MNKIERAIRDLQLYIDVKWGGTNDMLNLALTALREKAERKLDDNTIEALQKHIETLQQENNGWRERYDELDAGHSRLFKDFCKLQQKIEQLRAQVARMREALTIANNYMPDIGQFCVCGKCKGCGTDIGYSGYEYCLKCARGIIDAALSDTPADYHNPAEQVQELAKAKAEGRLVVLPVKVEDTKVNITITWYEPNEKRDPDNIMAGAKFILDGLVKAGTIPNDSQKYVRGIVHRFKVDRKNPRVEVEIVDVEKNEKALEGQEWD